MNNLWQNASTWIATCRDKSKKTLPPGSTATVTVLALFALCFAQVKNFSPKEEVTTSRTIRLSMTRELAKNYPPDSGITESHAPIVISEDLLDTGTRGNPVVVKAGRYYLGETSYPPGTKVRILKHIKEGDPTLINLHMNKDQFVILIGKTREQIMVPSEAILEAGGTPGPPITAQSIQDPREISTHNWHGPEGIWTGLAVGDEDIESNREDEQAIFRMVNQIRAGRGLSPLTWDEDLARAARYHAADCLIQEYTNHNTLDVQRREQSNAEAVYCPPKGIIDTPKDRIFRFVGTHHGVGENIASGKSPQNAVDKWMNSPGHRANILDPRWRKTGIGYVKAVHAKQVQVFSD